MIGYELPNDIQVYQLGTQRLYVRTGARSFAISENDVTPEELVGIARDIAARKAGTPAMESDLAVHPAAPDAPMS